MTWNYRWYRWPQNTRGYSCHETFYDAAGRPNARSENPLSLTGYEYGDEALFDLGAALGALDKPALDPETYAEVGPVPHASVPCPAPEEP